jgi:hypothetical protein
MGFEPTTPSLGSEETTTEGQESRSIVISIQSSTPHETAAIGSPCTVVMHGPRPWSSAAADAAIRAYLREMAAHLADRVRN